MKLYTLTTDTELHGRHVQSFATMAEAEAALFDAILKEAEIRGDLDALPPMESGDWRDAWEHAFPHPGDLAWIDEIHIPGEAIIPGANPDAMELHEIAKLPQSLAVPGADIGDMFSAMEQAADALHRAGRMIEEGARTMWALASDGRDGTNVQVFHSESACNDAIWRMITPDYDWRGDDPDEPVDPDEYRARFDGDWGAAMEHYTPEHLTFQVEPFSTYTPDPRPLIQQLAGTVNSLRHQVEQMRGMFDDDDGTIAAALQDADDADEALRKWNAKGGAA